MKSACCSIKKNRALEKLSKISKMGKKFVEFDKTPKTTLNDKHRKNGTRLLNWTNMSKHTKLCKHIVRQGTN